MGTNRLANIDGFRAVAVLGVIWAHIWMFFDNPPLLIAGKDISPIFTFWGNGVDLFFVISGFCMYLMFVSKYNKLSIPVFKDFITKRFIRIAPAFYAAIVMYYLWDYFIDTGSNSWFFALSNLFFVNTLTGVAGPAPHFWSLNTEFQFYALLPLLFLVFTNNYKQRLLILLIAALSFRLIAGYYNYDPKNIVNYLILYRILEFMAGMWICKIYLDNAIPKFVQSPWFFIVAFGIAFFGRILMTSSFHYRSDLIGIIARTVNIPILSLGFGLMIMSCLGKTHLFTKIVSNKFFLFVGKYSYSMYLWHWLIGAEVVRLTKKLSLNGFINVNLSFLITLLFLIPVSLISYNLLEAFYFKVYSSKKSI